MLIVDAPRRRAITLEGELPQIATLRRRPRPSDPPGLDDPVVRAAYEAGIRAAATALRARRCAPRVPNYSQTTYVSSAGTGLPAMNCWSTEE